LLAQDWVWMHGTSTAYSNGITGPQNTFGPTYTPDSKYEPAEWVDNNGHYWLWGGKTGNMSVGINVGVTDMWQYDPAINQWAWMGGSNSSSAGNNGVKGTAAATNLPMGRQYNSMTWTDNNGVFWMYSGCPSNDLWKYDPNPGANQYMWTWMHGNNFSTAPNWGTKNAALATNTPGDRGESSCTWTDSNGHLWLFGGADGGFNLNFYSDLWEYDPVTNMWTWRAGPNVSNQAGNYGVKGIAAATNVPSARGAYTSWIEKKGPGKDVLWVFGGANFKTNDSFNELWKYDQGTGWWTWMGGGSTTINVTNANFGTNCVYSSNNWPPKVGKNRTRWVDDCGNFWAYIGGTDAGCGDGYSSVWEYSPTLNQWRCVKGNSSNYVTGNYGTKLVPSPTNVPPGRFGAVGWRNANGIWIFGGWTTTPAIVNDLWKYIPEKPIAAFNQSAVNGCAPANVNFTDASNAPCGEIKSYLWNFGDPSSGVNNTSSLVNPSHTFNSSGTYTIKLVVTGCLGMKDSTTHTFNAITVSSTVTSKKNPTCNGGNNGEIIVNGSGGTNPYSYTWQPGGVTGSTISSLGAGTYTVLVKDASGCTVTNTITLTQPVSLTATITAWGGPSCNGGNNGWANVLASGGTGTYSYAWSPSGGTTSSATNLNANTYTVTVTDINSCTVKKSVSITQPAAIVANPVVSDAHCSHADGSAIANASGGTGAFTYQWSNNTTNSTVSGLSPGNYQLIVRDANNCSVTSTFTVGNLAGVTAQIVSTNSVSCNGGCNGSIVAGGTGGNTPYNYLWSNNQNALYWKLFCYRNR